MLEVKNLTRNYGSFVAVNNVSFTIQKGEIIGLLGHNGAGKTTIMKMISGYLEADQGTVFLEGLSLNDTPKALQKRLGYLPENLPVYPEMIVADYLDYAADLKGLAGQEKINEIKRAIKATDIAQKLLAPISTLSRGFKQRVGVAQAILGKPKLLILDEPTNGLDPEQTQHMRELIRQIAEEATVILSTHIMQEVDALCDRVLMLNNGNLVVDEQLENLRHSKNIIVETDCPDLSRLNGIDSLEQVVWQDQQTPVNKILLTLKPQADSLQTRQTVVKTLVADNHAVFAIYPEKRDLESLFNQLNTEELTQEVANVA